jgi:hypothetical protein
MGGSSSNGKRMDRSLKEIEKSAFWTLGLRTNPKLQRSQFMDAECPRKKLMASYIVVCRLCLHACIQGSSQYLWISCENLNAGVCHELGLCCWCCNSQAAYVGLQTRLISFLCKRCMQVSVMSKASAAGVAIYRHINGNPPLSVNKGLTRING